MLRLERTGRLIRPVKDDVASRGKKTAAKKPKKAKRVFRTGTDRLIDRSYVERILKISRSTVIRYEKLGLLKPVKLNKVKNGRVRYSFNAIIRFRDGK